MNRRLAVVTSLALLALAGEALGCGDKFLIVGRGARYQRIYVAVHPSSLLLLNANITGRKDIQAQLKRAGHRVSLVSSPEQLRQAVSSSAYDAVLADLADIPRLAGSLSDMPKPPLLLPVIDGTSNDRLRAAAAQYKCLLEPENGRKTRRFLARLDAALDSRLKATPLNCEVKP